MNFALVFGLIAVVVVLVSGYEEEYAEYGVIMRLTIQGVHPIPFAQSIGLGLISSLFLILRNIKKQIKSNLLFFKTALLTIILLYTNTRGVIISFVISMLFVLVFSMKKPTISKKIISVFLITTALLSSVVLFLLDFESLFGRFYSDESALISVFLRFVSIEDSIDIFINNLFTGIGPVGFSYISDFFNQMKVIPVSISYEFDPNDLNKAKEVYETEVNGFYEKKENEDLESISRGISGFKGSVVLNIGNVMNFESDSYEIVAEQITNEISNQFHNHPTNKDALSILNKDLKLEDNEYFSERLKDEPDEVKSILLNQYANSAN